MNNGFETPLYGFCTEVRDRKNSRVGTVRAYLGWERPIVLYGVLYEDGVMSEWLSQSELELI